jgi:hypothetical protein
MDEDRRKVHEYYQVNLDTGRIFWIAFLLGLILIAVFVFGFFFGGGEEENLFSRLTRGEILDREGDGELFPGEDSGEEGILGLFENGLEVETRYIDVESLEEAAEGPASAGRGDTAAAGEDPAGREDAWDMPKEEPSYAYEPPPREKVVSPERTGAAYFIQVGSFAKRENAERFAERLRKNLYKVIIEEAVVGGDTFYRVRVGPFESRGVAVNTMTAMRRRYDLRDPFVLQKHS